MLPYLADASNLALRDSSAWIGIKKANGRMVFNPESHTVLDGQDTLIVLGEPSSILKLEKLVTEGTPAP